MASVNLGKVGLLLRGAWDSSTDYAALDVVSHEGYSYAARVANKNVEPSAETAAYWQPLAESASVLSTMLGYKNDAADSATAAAGSATSAATSASSATDALANEAADFSSSKAYAIGDYVIYNNGTHKYLYRFTAAHSAGAWVGTDATQVALADDVSTLKSAMNATYDVLFDAATELITELEFVEGSFNMSGEANSVAGYVRSAPVYIKKGSIVISEISQNVGTGLWTGTSMTSASCIERITFNNSGIYFYQASSDGYFRITFQDELPASLPETVKIYLIKETSIEKIASLETEVSTNKQKASDDFHSLTTPVSDTSIFSQGGISSSTGSNSSSTTRIRTTTYLPDNAIAIHVTSGYKFIVFAYNNSGYVGVYNGSTFVTTAVWFTEDINFRAVSRLYKYRIVVAKSNDSSISPSDATNVTIFYDPYNENIAKSLKPVFDYIDMSADAKTITVTDYTNIAGYITSENNWVSSTNANSVMIPVVNTWRIDVEPNETNGSEIAFLKTAKKVYSSAADMCVSMNSLIVIDKSAGKQSYYVPEDCTYLYVRKRMLSTAASTTIPKSLVFVNSMTVNMDKVVSLIMNSLPFVNDTATGRDIPENRGVLNAYKKAHQLLDVVWTAKEDVPTRSIIPGSGITKTIVAGETCTGVPYSSVKELDKFVGMMVSLKTFMTAVNNPYSLLYTEVVYGGASASEYGFTYHGTNCASYYGMVCSAFVEYALGWNVYYDTDLYEYLAKIGKLEKIYDQSGEGLKLCDIYWIPGHVRLITDIIRDSRGTPTSITFTESAGTLPKSTTYSLETFNRVMAQENAIIYRYNDLYKNLEYEPSEFVAVENETLDTYVYNDDICTFAGDYAAFHSNDTIYINYTLGSYTGMELYKDDTLIQTISLNNSSVHKLDVSSYCIGYGMYKARMIGNGNSEYTYFMVIDTQVSVVNANDILTVTFSSANGDPMYIQLCNQAGAALAYYELSEAEKTAGTAVIDAHRVRYEQFGTEGYGTTAYLRVFFKGDYGVVNNVPIDAQIGY